MGGRRGLLGPRYGLWAGQRNADRLAVLCLDYEMAREDERTFQSIQAALVGVAVALTAALSAVLTRSKVLLDEPPESGAELIYVPEPLLVVTPLVPYALVAFAVLLGAVSTIRSYYLRALEAELHGFAGGNLRTLPFPPGRYAELMSELVSVRRGIRWYPYLVLFILIAALLIFGGFVAYIYSGLDTTVARLAMIALYLPASIFLLVQTGQATIGGRGLFADVGRSYLERKQEGRSFTVPTIEAAKEEGATGNERSISWYLVLPRPEDVPKTFILPLVYLVASSALGSFSGDALLRAVVVWIAFEYLLYQARYQWNDIRGLHEEDAEGDGRLRRRLPLGENFPETAVRNVRLSVGIILARLALAVVLALAAGYETLAPIVVLMAAIGAIAVPYEWLRSRAADEWISARKRKRLVGAIWAFVGSGYALRGMTGLWLAGFALDSAVMAFGALAFGASGVMFVTLTWALESLAHSKRSADGEVVPGDGRRKLHADALLTYMDVPSPPYGESEDPVHAKGLLARGHRYLAPWNLALFAAMAFGGALGVGIQGDAGPGGWAVAAALSLAGSFALAYVEHDRRLPVLLGVSVLLALLGATIGGRTGLFATLPWLSFGALYVAFRNSSYYSLRHWFGDLRTPVERALLLLVAIVVGSKTLAKYPQLRGGLRPG